MAGFKDKMKKVAATVGEGSKKVAGKAQTAAKAIGEGSKAAATKTKDVAKSIGSGGKKAVETTHDAVIKAMDQDGNGIIDSTDLILASMKVPGVKIDREKFLRKEFMKKCPPEVIDKIIATNPAKAGISPEVVDGLVEDTMKFERNAVSGISMALGVPGGAAMVATIPVDIAQYYGCMLRAAQKMLYLYGFPELNTKGDDVSLDSETMNSLTICLGVMYGVANAGIAIKAMAKALATGVEKQLLKRALTKGTIYPIVKSVAKWFGARMTKQVFAGFFKKAIPVVGGVISGGLTYATFGPCCHRLKEALKDTELSNPHHEETKEELEMFEGIRNGEIIDVEPDEIRPVDEENDEE